MSSAQVSPRRVVLGLNGGPTDALVVRIACELVRQTKGTLAGVHIVEVDWSHDLSEDIASDNEAAAAVLDLAETMPTRPAAGWTRRSSRRATLALPSSTRRPPWAPT
jgi:hypothetical protein